MSVLDVLEEWCGILREGFESYLDHSGYRVYICPDCAAQWVPDLPKGHTSRGSKKHRRGCKVHRDLKRARAAEAEEHGDATR